MRLQNAALEYLAANLTDLVGDDTWTVPVVYCATDGDSMVAIPAVPRWEAGAECGDGACDDTDGEKVFLVRVLSYLPGRPYSSLESVSLEFLGALGRGVGAMDRIMLGFSPPSETTDDSGAATDAEAGAEAGAESETDAEEPFMWDVAQASASWVHFAAIA